MDNGDYDFLNKATETLNKYNANTLPIKLGMLKKVIYSDTDCDIYFMMNGTRIAASSITFDEFNIKSIKSVSDNKMEIRIEI
jgi:hypothetical protein